MRLQKIEKAINNMSDDKFSELLNELGVKEQWVPEYNKNYYFVSAGGNILGALWENNTYDNHRLLMNNVFKTKEEAIVQRDFNFEKAKLIKEIEDSSDVIDWKVREEKYYLYLLENKLRVDSAFYSINQGVTYTTNKEFLEYLINKESERVKKYLFGIGEEK